MRVDCDCCHKNFYIKSSEYQRIIKNSNRFHCSKDCRIENTKRKNTINCKQCGKEYLKKHSDSIFCGKSCAASHNNLNRDLRGDKHPNWINGDFSYPALAKRYYRLECAICGINEEYCLQVHHIDQNRKNNTKENLIILCANHHCIVHYKKNISMEELIIYQNSSKLDLT